MMILSLLLFTCFCQSLVATPLVFPYVSVLPYQRLLDSLSQQPKHINHRNQRRKVQFWLRVGRIYSSYKLFQLKDLFQVRLNASYHSMEEWAALHELNSQRMVDLCLTLRGFYLKSGQFLGTRHDFMPPQYTSKLCKLHDDVPPLEAAVVQEVVEKELQGPIDDYFMELNLTKPLGAASVAQVHAGRWRRSGERVAVKIQYPDAESLMKSDLANLQRLASFLQHTELKFDLLSAITELRSQISHEFDFRREARHMDEYGAKLMAALPSIVTPRSIFSSNRLLIMTYVEGANLGRLAEYNRQDRRPPSGVQKTFSRWLLRSLAKVWGLQIFEYNTFHADPHPGNICITKDRKIGILDWGQVKSIGKSTVSKFATLIEALHKRQQQEIIDAFTNLGVIVRNPHDRDTTENLAISVFDTRKTDNFVIDPFSDDSAIKKNAIVKLPSDLYFVVRVVQLIRGMSHALDVPEFSLADEWMPYVQRFRADQHESSLQGPRQS